MLGHPGLAQRETGEHSNRVQRDEPVHLTTGGCQGADGGPGKEEDAVGEHQPVAAYGELPRHEVVAR